MVEDGLLNNWSVGSRFLQGEPTLQSGLFIAFQVAKTPLWVVGNTDFNVALAVFNDIDVRD